MILLGADNLLRARPWAVQAGETGTRLVQLAGLIVVFGVIYGAIMGSFGGFADGRILQAVYSALKVPLLLIVTFALSLPCFFILNTLWGLRSDFSMVLRALLATQAGMTVILASLGPFTALWYFSSSNYQGAILFNLLMFSLASISAQVLLRKFYRPLLEKNDKHRLLLRVWFVIYGFVGIQIICRQI